MLLVMLADGTKVLSGGGVLRLSPPLCVRPPSVCGGPFCSSCASGGGDLLENQRRVSQMRWILCGVASVSRSLLRRARAAASSQGHPDKLLKAQAVDT